MLVPQQLARLLDELVHVSRRFLRIRLERAHRQYGHAGFPRISSGQSVTQAGTAHHEGETMPLDRLNKELNTV